MVPPIKLWDQGVPNQAALTIMTRNSRMPESLAGDLDAECSACLMGARRLGELFERYGVATVEACFDAIVSNNTDTYRREILPKIPDGTYVWEDYAEHDGVDEPKLHRQRITLTKEGGDDRRRAADPRLHRHLAAGQGPDQPRRRPRRRQLPQEVARADAAQPRRHAGADGRARRQRGHRRPHRDALPATGHAAHPDLPGADQRADVRDPAAARRAVGGAGQGRRRPDARRPGDHPLHRRLRHPRRRHELPDARGARRRLRRSPPRRRRGHHPRGPRLAEPADRVHRVAVPVPGRVARARPGLRWCRASTAAGSATTSTSGCSRTPTSCPSPTGRSCRAGGSRAARPARRSGSPSTRAARTNARWRASSTTNPSGPAR